MLHLYGLPPRLFFVQGGHANCKVCSLTHRLLLIVVLLLAKKFLIFSSLALILQIAHAAIYFMPHVIFLGRAAVTIVISDQRLING